MIRPTEQDLASAPPSTVASHEEVRTPSRAARFSRVSLSPVVAANEILDEESFHRAISTERKRTERSRKPFLLLLLDMSGELHSSDHGDVVNKACSVLSLATREIDVTGWYRVNSLGILFTEISTDDRGATLTTLLARVTETLRSNLTAQQFARIRITSHLYPENWDRELLDEAETCDRTLYPDLSRRDQHKKLFAVVKRIMDMMGSALALAFLGPLFLAIAAAIKLTSQGPVFFRQKRVGQYGKSFTLLKFRSMRINNDARVHEQYVKQLIAGQADRKKSGGNGTGVYKLTNDPRITRIGSILRRTSLDEIPQFINVLKGEMSLVGPRPAIAYEVEAYDIWHRRRVLECKPGITGLWQVKGRSRVTFDQMVRFDLQYAKNWSPWLDLKILLRTPAAVVMGDGAY